MRVNISITWLGVILVLGAIVILTLRGVSVYKIITQEIIKEGFVESEDSSDLNITSCPVDTISFNDMGKTLCCDGDIVGGKCNGSIACSLSGSSGGQPSCSEWLAAKLEIKGKDFCTPSMPHYYEDSKTGIRGCTGGKRTKDGTAPLSKTDKYCVLYKTQDEDMLTPDSCINQKMLEETSCFSHFVDKTSKTLVGGKDFPPMVNCSVLDIKAFQAGNCLEQTTFARSIDYLFKKHMPGFTAWKDDSAKWPPQYKLSFCSVMQKMNIDKSIKFDDLKTISVF